MYKRWKTDESGFKKAWERERERVRRKIKLQIKLKLYYRTMYIFTTLR